MIPKLSLILPQSRNPDILTPFASKYYYFPQEQLTYFTKHAVEFVFSENIEGENTAFYGSGKIARTFPDPNNGNFYFGEIADYRSFTKDVTIGELIVDVEEISPERLEEICLDGGIKLNFKADAHLIKVLGEQLIGSEKVGILELIKNAIDASATYCKVRIEKADALPASEAGNYEFNEYPGTVIIIEDDGTGMTKNLIEQGWLRPASTIKTNVKEKLRTERKRAEELGALGSYNSLIEQLKKENKGRIPLGEKGVGRFATHRLGRNLIIKTKTAEVPYEYILKINWDDFDVVSDQSINLESVGVELTRQPPSRNYGERDSGTQLIIYGGRNGFTWDRNGIEDINRSILNLNSPNPNPKRVQNSFRAFLICPQIPDLPRVQIYETFEPNFSLHALVNTEGVIEDYTVDFKSPKSVPLPSESWTGQDYDLKKASAYWREDDGSIRKPKCGSFFIHLDAWYRRKPWIDGPDYNLMLEYLEEYGGISIYRDDIIIFPAESGAKNDWLSLSNRHIKQGFRISYYNIIGNIEIEQSENLDLIDKTNREGMIENVAFKDLAKLCETIIQNLLETKFINKRDEFTNLTKGIIRDPKKLTEITAQNSKIISGIREFYPIADDPWNILHQLGSTVEERKGGLINLDTSLKNLKKSIDLIEDVQERLTEHAGFGIAISVSLHEINKITTNFYNGINQLIKSGNYDSFQLEDLKAASASLKSELKRLSPLRSIRNENRIEFKLSQSINYAFEVARIKLNKENIKYSFNADQDFQVYARYSTTNQILGNLIDNAIYWILANGKNSKREIKIQLNKQYRTLTFADSGVGIDDAIRPYLFEPGYSMKIPPSGLGLYICKTYMHSMQGNIHETINREKLSDLEGAQFTIEFDTVPSQKENAK
jgi:signal transduction histidine kinase